MSKVIPIQILQWSKDDWVSKCISESGLSIADIIAKNINMNITGTGSTLLHLVTMSAHRPSTIIANHALKALLELGADPNAQDFYGRTPLTNLITHSPSVLYQHEDIGFEMFNALMEKNADPNIMFTPDYLCYSNCKLWTLAHDLQNRHHGLRRWPIPNQILTVLNQKLDFSKPNSEGKAPELKQLEFRK